MALVTCKDYHLVLLPGFTIPPAWYSNLPVPHHHDQETILLQPAPQPGPVHLSPKSKIILANSQPPHSWTLLHAAEAGIASAAEAIVNKPHNAVLDVHLACLPASVKQPHPVWDPELESLLRAARDVAPPDFPIHSGVYNAGGPLHRLSLYSRHIVCGAAVMTLSLKERNEIWNIVEESNSGRKLSRVGIWKIDKVDQLKSVARFKGTTRFFKDSGLEKVNFDSELMEHIQIDGCYKNTAVIMGGWMTRMLIPGNQQFRNLLCASELTFYIDHGLDHLGIINMYKLFCKLAGCIELGVGVMQAGLAFATAMHNDLKRTLEEWAGQAHRSVNVRMNHIDRFQFISAMICDIGVFEVMAYEEFGDVEVNDGALCGFLQDFTDVGEDSACGELGLSLGAWGDTLDTKTVTQWISDLARLQNDGLFHRRKRPIVIANYLITFWNCTDGRHHTLARALSYLRHTKLGSIDGYTQIYDLFDEKMNYIGDYNSTGALEEVDGESLLKESCIGWEKARTLKKYGNLAIDLVTSINQMRRCERVLESGLLLIRWFIYIPRMLMEDIQNVQFAQDMGKLCLQVEDQFRTAIMVISCWMKFDDREFGFFRCRERCAESAALYSLDNRLDIPIEEFHTNFNFLGKTETRF